METLRAPAIDLRIFDASFFAEKNSEEHQAQMLHEASEALGNILKITDDEGGFRTKDQIERETELFFSDPAIAESMALMDSLALQYAHFCGEHEHMTPQPGNSMLSSVKDRGDSLRTEKPAQKESSEKNDKKKEKEKSKKKKDAKKKNGKYAAIKKRQAMKASGILLRLF